MKKKILATLLLVTSITSGSSLKKALLATIILPSFVLAGSEPTISPFPDAKKGINILSIEKIDMPMKKETIKSLTAFASNGYIDTTETDQSVNLLFSLPKIAAKEARQYNNDPNPLDTHLKSSISKLRLSFNFAGIPGIEKENVLGFAPAGGYTKEEGWDGVVEFVEFPNLGICSFTTMKIEKVILFKETLEHEISKKPSDKNIAGNWNTGFLYTVNWYTDNRVYTFECANKDLNPKNMKEMVRIANQIDSSLD